MSAIADIPRSDMFPISANQRTVASEPGEKLFTMMQELERQREQSTAVRSMQRLQVELNSLFIECNRPSWDGYDAFPISPSILQNARRFIAVLPASIRLPEVSAEPDGAIAFDWILTKSRMLSISVGQNDRLAYAWLDGTNSGRGVERFELGVFPPMLKTIIELICGLQNA